jgi:hypothetical protein
VSRAALLLLLVAACDCAGEPADHGGESAEATSGSEPVAPAEVEDPPHDHAHEGESGAEMVEAGCEQGRVDDCVALAEGGDHEALRQACETSGQLCSVAGEPALLERGCRAGSRPSCRAWAEHGGGDAARALGCAAGWLEACEEAVPGCDGTLADCVERSRAALAEGDVETAQRLARLGCDGERTAGCLAWAEAYGAQDPDAAKVALRRACFAEDRGACEALVARDDLSPMERRRAQALARGLRF